MDALIAKLDEINQLLHDVERARASAVRFAIESKGGHAAAQVDLVAAYLEVAAMRTAEAKALAKRAARPEAESCH